MTWKCDAKRTGRNPRNQYVVFYFAKKPQVADLLAAPGLCDRLTTSGRATVTIDYDVWGNSFDGLVGYKPIRIDAAPFADALSPHVYSDSIGIPLEEPFLRH